jgi:hypothetical protein
MLTNSGAAAGFTPPGTRAYKGGKFRAAKDEWDFYADVNGRHVFLGNFITKNVRVGARLRDSVEVLLHGVFADTNFDVSTYKPGNIQAAADLLRSKGISVRQARAAAAVEEVCTHPEFTCVVRATSGTCDAAECGMAGG